MNEWLQIKKSTLVGIADKIRDKTGKSERIAVTSLADEIENISTGGYVIAAPIEVTLDVNKWNGTTYTLTMTGYTPIYELQIGLPEVSSSTNTAEVVKSALTIPQTSASTDSSTGVTTVTIVISAITAPTIDIDVALFGLVAQEVEAEA